MSTEAMPAQGPVDVTVGPVAWAKIFRGRTDLVLGCAMQAEDAMELGWVPLYAIPEGWALAPKEPTKEMMQAGFDVKGSHLYGLTYRAMLDAAPAPPNA